VSGVPPTSRKATTQSRATFTLVLRAEPGNVDPVKSMRRLLKAALRTFKFRCTEISERERPS
jgi:hypothetical protein